MIHAIVPGYKMRLLETQIRDQNTPVDELREALFTLGKIMGDEVLGQCKLSAKNIFTPLLARFSGVRLTEDTGLSIIISTKDDYQYFAQGIAEGCASAYRGYIDFGGARGQDVYSSPYRSLELPNIRSSLPVKRIIIAKSVIASGCTAASLAKTALAKYTPEDLIIIAPFFSQQGVEELQEELKRAEIYVAFGPDDLTTDGMLTPGLGNIDARLAM